MIRPVDTLLSTLGSRPKPAGPKAPAKWTDAPTSTGPGLASSIMADGGLGFLRSRMEEKLGALFEDAAEKNPELAAAGPAAFFDQDRDVSPEATADRIVSFALGLKGVFARQNEDLSPQEMMSRFEAEIRGGIEDGFDHARSVLGGLDLLDGDVAGNVDATWDLVQQKLEEFFRPDEAGADPEEGQE